MEPRHTRPLQTARPTGRNVLRRVQGTTKTTKDVEFILQEPSAHTVTLAGSFNDWDPKKTPMQKDAKGDWKVTVPLHPGRYEYRFVVDGRWISDPKARESAPNDFGSTNSVLAV